MNRAFVLDSSVALSWCFEDQQTDLSEAALHELQHGGTGLVPSLWAIEVANVLVRAVRQKILSQDRADEFVQLLLGLPLQVKSTPRERALRDVRSLATKAKLSAYDATYLELAARLGARMATLDEGLRKAAGRAGVGLLGQH